jgi:hypothetical protein
MAGTKSRYITLSIKVRREVKDKLDHAGVKPGEIMRKALSDAIDEAEKKELLDEWKSVRAILEKIPEERIIKSIREDREQ